MYDRDMVSASGLAQFSGSTSEFCYIRDGGFFSRCSVPSCGIDDVCGGGLVICVFGFPKIYRLLFVRWVHKHFCLVLLLPLEVILGATPSVRVGFVTFAFTSSHRSDTALVLAVLASLVGASLAFVAPFLIESRHGWYKETVSLFVLEHLLCDLAVLWAVRGRAVFGDLVGGDDIESGADRASDAVLALPVSVVVVMCADSPS